VDPIGTPYVAYRDANNLYKLTVMRFNGTSWEVVGTPGFSDGQSYYMSLTLDSGDIPYVAYTDAANSWRLTVQKFNGSSWEVVGTT
jgi:hypothetical protein